MDNLRGSLKRSVKRECGGLKRLTASRGLQLKWHKVLEFSQSMFKTRCSIFVPVSLWTISPLVNFYIYLYLRTIWSFIYLYSKLSNIKNDQ